jgi:hypothetical protein
MNIWRIADKINFSLLSFSGKNILSYLKWFQNLRSGSRARRRPIEKAQSRRRREPQMGF